MIRGIPLRSVTSDIANVSEEANAPRIAQQLFSAISLCAIVAALFGVDVESAISNEILAPPRPLSPPLALISSATSSTPCFEFTPNCAFAPDRGSITPTLTVFDCANDSIGQLLASPKPTNELNFLRVLRLMEFKGLLLMFFVFIYSTN